ncbi:MBL fold metallo-hydrolase [Streptomyces palmae]|uniref:MBL fold metallo-hydrolase n=1 Tax=Streptomyces palmae TaxID=1701085 RepID=A0A4Z0HC31_9ACTN|nr:MBL fold metallo-hydrolase [Streptomyces palmae]TGB10213.1 MBL fold metallo-hydrolase [Streptomyces palmae]
MTGKREHPDRRRILRGVGTVGAGALASWAGVTGAQAAVTAGPRGTDARTEDPRIVSRRAGRFEVLALRDAHGTFPGKRQDLFPAAQESDWEQAARIDPGAFGPDGAWELDFRCYAIRRPTGRVTLVDMGVGPAGSPASKWAPVPGHLPEVLAAAGIERGDVDSVVLTHVHEDHYGWAVGLDGTPMFPDARHVVQRTEIASLGPGDSAWRYVVDPLRRAGLLQEIDGEVPLLRGRDGGVVLKPTPGHTPGHQSVLVDGGRRRILVTGDVLVHAVQLAAPSVAYRLESDQAAARRTREAVLADARRHRTLLATSHVNHPFLRP